VPEPFTEEFQNQAFEESLFFFVEQQGKCESCLGAGGVNRQNLNFTHFKTN
jgi:excinuclease UvrABC ATPase subunit